MRFEWDETKAESNYRKHKVRFDTAAQVFRDPHCLMTLERDVDGEERWQTIGMVDGILLLFVAHTVEDDQDEDLTVRIISARKVTPVERRRYESEAYKGRPGWVEYRLEPGDPMSDEVKANIEELLRKPDSEIDTSDIPELPADAWKHAVRGRFYRPLKEAVSLRLDADVLAWLKKDGQGYQTRVNRMLRERMLKDLEGR